MKTFCLSICLAALLFAPLGFSIMVKSTFTPQQEIKTGSKEKTASEFNAYIETRRKTFQPARQLLLDYGIQFDPDLLMDENWRELLESTFSRMPEMKKVIHGSGILKGVIIAHTLVLPERVGLATDTVIIATHLVFQGKML